MLNKCTKTKGRRLEGSNPILAEGSKDSHAGLGPKPGAKTHVPQLLLFLPLVCHQSLTSRRNKLLSKESEIREGRMLTFEAIGNISDLNLDTSRLHSENRLTSQP